MIRRKSDFNTVERVLAMGLIAVTALSLSACGSSGEQTADSSTDAAADGYVWVAEYAELPEDTDVYNAVFSGDFMYVITENWDDEGNQADTSYEQISLVDGTVTELFTREPSLTTVEDGVSYYRYTNYYDVTEDGSFITVDGASSYNKSTGESTSNYYLCRYSASGEQDFEIDITGDVDPDGSDSNYLLGMVMDGDGRVCVATGTGLLLYDADGNSLGGIEVDSANGWIQTLGTDGVGQAYMVYYDYSSGSGGYQLRKIDFEAKNADTTFENFPSDTNYLGAGNGATILAASSDCLYRYDTETQTCEELIKWLDCDIYGSYVCGVSQADDGRVIALVNDWESGEYSVAYMTETPASEVVQKTQIVIGTYYDDSSLSSAIVKFNKSSDQYHVALRTYIDYTDCETQEDYTNARTDALTRLNNEITSDEGPDLLLLESVNVEQYAAKGVFANLTSYLENSTVVSRDDYFENILQAYTYQDQLIAIPQTFSLLTIAGKTADVGEEPGWTLDEMMAYANEHPDAQIFDYSTKAYMLQTLVTYNQSKYIDWETGQCSFDQEEFIKVLEFANSFPDEYTYDEDEPSTPNKLASGQLLLYMTSIYEPSDMQMAEAMYGEDVTYIGFPNEDGASGTYLYCSSPIAILAKSENQEGAWAFLEYYLDEGESEWYSYGFSARKEKFEEQLANSMTTDYTDENGDPYLNEEGYALTGGGMSYEDDWSYDYRVTTEEEAELLREMIENAQPANSMDDEILSIITEEADSYFSGDKSAADTAAVIQSRVQIYVNEQK